jgi:dolichol kinase
VSVKRSGLFLLDFFLREEFLFFVFLSFSAICYLVETHQCIRSLDTPAHNLKYIKKVDNFSDVYPKGIFFVFNDPSFWRNGL